MKLKSPAKVNLYLRILNKRPDGYHNIVTLFERIGLFDEITICRGTACRAPTIKITCSNPNIPTGPENLAYKAAQALLDYTGKNLGCRIAIKKRIPVAAGLGGGSSNAATVLLGLNKLWNLRLSRKVLFKLGAKIGADVNFFLSGARLAIGTGKGEVILPLQMKRPLWHILVMPETGLSTKDIYELYDRHCEPTARLAAKKAAGRSRRRSNLLEAGRLLRSPLRGSLAMTKGCGKFALTAALTDVKILHHSIRNNNLALLAKTLRNDLQEPAQVKDKTIHKIKTALKSCKAKAALLSGSGPAVYGIAASGKEAMRIRAGLAHLKNNWQIFAVKTY